VRDLDGPRLRELLREILGGGAGRSELEEPAASPEEGPARARNASRA
jgi:hypothetical protein